MELAGARAQIPRGAQGPPAPPSGSNWANQAVRHFRQKYPDVSIFMIHTDQTLILRVGVSPANSRGSRSWSFLAVDCAGIAGWDPQDFTSMVREHHAGNPAPADITRLKQHLRPNEHSNPS